MSRKTEQQKWKRNMKLKRSAEEKLSEKSELEINLEILLVRCNSQCTLKGRVHATETFNRVFKY